MPGVKSYRKAEAAERGGLEKNAKMKVHPAILMKTKKGRFQVSDASCQGLGPGVGCRAQGDWLGIKAKMKVHPAIFMKTNRGRYQVSGARCQRLGGDRIYPVSRLRSGAGYDLKSIRRSQNTKPDGFDQGES